MLVQQRQELARDVVATGDDAVEARPVLAQPCRDAAGDGRVPGLDAQGLQRLRVGAGMLEVRGQEHHVRSEEHTSELQSLMRSSYAVFCLKKKNTIEKDNKLIYPTLH